jgi:two-component sensor histidine kinase
LNQVHDNVLKYGFQIDKDKTEVAWIFTSERSRAPSRLKVAEWKQGIIRKFDIKAKEQGGLGSSLTAGRHRLALN